MGTYASDRQHKVEELFLEPSRLMANFTFVLAGSLYPKDWKWPENIKRFDHVAPAAHPSLYSSSRATLNITRNGMARRGYCPSGRFFEAAACGTPIFSDWFEGLDFFFRPVEEIILVNTASDVTDALEASEEELTTLATRARDRTLAEHTGDARAGQLLQYLDEANVSMAPDAPKPGSRVDTMEVTS